MNEKSDLTFLFIIYLLTMTAVENRPIPQSLCNKKFQSALAEAENGKIYEAIHHFQNILLTNPRQYAAYINLSTLFMQAGEMHIAKQTLGKAIKIDPFNFMGYYNLFAILNCHQKQIKSAPQLLLKTLSCLYQQIGRKNKDRKMLNKSLSLSEDNSLAYIYRAEISEAGNKIKLAENDYQAAIYHFPQHSFLYLKKAEFQWRIKNFEKSAKTIEEYHRLKSLQISTKLQSQEIDFKSIGISSREWTEAELSNMHQTIKEKIQEFQQQLQVLNGENPEKEEIMIKSTNNVNNNNKKVEELEEIIEESENNRIEEEEVQINRSIEKMASNKIDELFNDENSKNLTAEIERLEKEIENEGGHLNEDSSQENQQTFLTQDIEQAVQEIESMKKLEHAVDPAASIGSGYTHLTLNEEELLKFKEIKIEIVSAQAFEGYEKESGKVLLTYGNEKKNTDAKADKFWRQVFMFNIQKVNDTPIDRIIIALEMKSQSIWSTKKIIGHGQISLLSTGDNKVIITNGEIKTAIVYFKLKLL